MELFIKDKWKNNVNKDLGFRFGRMVKNMKVNGKMIKQMEKEKFFFQMVTFFKVYFQIKMQMVKENIQVRME